MHRDIDLVRRMLMNVADQESVRIEGIDLAIVEYYARLLEEGGLLSGYSQKKMASQFAVGAPRLTWRGHEFLDLARNEHRWLQVKQLISEVQGASFEVLTNAMSRLAEREIAERLADE